MLIIWKSTHPTFWSNTTSNSAAIGGGSLASIVCVVEVRTKELVTYMPTVLAPHASDKLGPRLDNSLR